MKFLLAAVIALGTAVAQSSSASGPDIQTYKTVGGAKLTAHLFCPLQVTATRRPAIVLFHGGGWSWGSPDWVYDAAKRYASYGAVAVAAEYRLSDQKSVTPLDAMADARDLVRWLRRNSAKLGIDPEHIAVYGVSAGGHLATSLATIDDPGKSDVSAIPNAIVLVSGVVSTEEDGWVQQLLGDRAKSADISPFAHLRKGLPPTIVLNGKLDTLTPIERAARFCDRAKELGAVCELHGYDGVGHLFTRKLDPKDQIEGNYDPDPKVWEDANAKGDSFLAQRGFLPLYVEDAGEKARRK